MAEHMKKTSVIMITSCKGGVGKSTVCANLGAALAMLGRKVLLIDLDFGMRCLDLICGFEDSALYDITDIISRGVEPRKAIVESAASPGLMFCAAPYSNDAELTEEAFAEGFERITEELSPDYILLDTHGGISRETSLAAGVSDKAYIVASHQVTTVRAAEKTDSFLAAEGLTDTRLIINRFDRRAVRKGELPGIIDIIDRSKVRLIGVIPDEPKAASYQEKGILCDHISDCNFKKAFRNVAARTEGASIPLLDGFRRFPRKIILK